MLIILHDDEGNNFSMLADELEPVAQRGEFGLERGDLPRVVLLRPVERRRAHAAADLAAEKNGYTATKHQREVGTGYFDGVAKVISDEEASTIALEDSTEASQFQEKQMEDIQYIDPNDDWYIPDDERDYQNVSDEIDGEE